MSNKETLQQNNTRINVNNNDLNSILNTINNLPARASGEINITENGEYDVARYEKANINVVELDLFPYVSGLTFTADFQEIREDVVLHLERAVGLGNMFDMKYINTPKMTVYISDKCTTLYRAFGRQGGDLEVLEIIGDTSKITTFNQMCQARSNLKQVVCEFDFSGLTSTAGVANMFNTCSLLEEVRLKPNTLSFSISFSTNPKLSNDSINSILNGLVDLTDGTAQTLTLHKDFLNKLTAEQKAVATNKNWNIGYL